MMAELIKFISSSTGPEIEAAVGLAATALQPAPVTPATITAGAIATPLSASGVTYTVQLSEDATTWTAALQSGGDASTFQYGALVRFTAPASGGPFVAAIPVTWKQTGELDAISLSAGDEDIICAVYSTPSDGREFAATQAA